MTNSVDHTVCPITQIMLAKICNIRLKFFAGALKVNMQKKKIASDVNPAVYHKRGNHTVTLYEKRVKIRYHLHGSHLG